MPGDVEVLKPVGYGIIRKNKYINHPSDHLVLPLDWINHSGRQKIIREVTLKLCKLNDSKKETGEEYLFELAGEFPSISASSFNNPPGLIPLLLFHQIQTLLKHYSSILKNLRMINLSFTNINLMRKKDIRFILATAKICRTYLIKIKDFANFLLREVLLRRKMGMYGVIGMKQINDDVEL